MNMSIRPEIVTINYIDTPNGEKADVAVWAIRNDPDAHPAGIVINIQGKKKSLEFTLTTAQVAELLTSAVAYMDNKAERIPFTE